MEIWDLDKFDIENSSIFIWRIKIKALSLYKQFNNNQYEKINFIIVTSDFVCWLYFQKSEKPRKCPTCRNTQ